eukprot:SAG25_NODE_5174_length_693_cov_0.710438_1_plen_99_part_01
MRRWSIGPREASPAAHRAVAAARLFATVPRATRRGMLAGATPTAGVTATPSTAVTATVAGRGRGSSVWMVVQAVPPPCHKYPDRNSEPNRLRFTFLRTG